MLRRCQGFCTKRELESVWFMTRFRRVVACIYVGKTAAATEGQTIIGSGTNMTTTIAPITQLNAWKALEAHTFKTRELHLQKLFAEDPERGKRLTVEAVGIYLDYSKNRITDETILLLLDLAEESGLRSRIDAMFRAFLS